MKEKKYTKQVATYLFKDKLDLVQSSLFNSNALQKLGINGLLSEQSQIKKHENLHTNNYLKKFVHPNNFSMVMKFVEKLVDPNIITLLEKVTEINNQKVTTNFFIRYTFYRNSYNNTTLLVFEAISDTPDDPFMEQYIINVPEATNVKYCQAIQNDLDEKNKEFLSIESIVIYRPMKQIINYFIGLNALLKLFKLEATNLIMEKEHNDKGMVIHVKSKDNLPFWKCHIIQVLNENDKAIIRFEREMLSTKVKTKLLVSFIQLSSTSCFVTVENHLKIKVTSNIAQSISEYYQNCLKSLKGNIEKEMCCS